ncbi:choline transport protein [Mycena olivaceomarginata]|nr:choline transport protein [Mycena olivaceomarginata]
MADSMTYRDEKKAAKEKNIQDKGRGRINASGHVDELDRQYGTAEWQAITIAVANGGAPGIIFEFLASCVYYGFVATSIAELASSIPSAGGGTSVGLLHRAAVLGPTLYHKHLTDTCRSNQLLRTGYSASLAIVMIPANVIIQMYVVFHPEFVVQLWHIFLVFVLINWSCCLTVVFFNRSLPVLQKFGLFMLVLASAKTHASASFVFRDWENATGWPDGVAFLTGMLNGAFAIGTPDSVTHMAEELPHPRRDLPRAVAAQIHFGARVHVGCDCNLAGFIYAVALMFAITDLDAVLTSNGSFPLAAVYAQATGNKAGTFGLLFIFFVSITACCIGVFITTGRIYWALARDNVTPFSSFFSKASARLSCPVPATLFCAILTTAFGAIQLGSKTAFADLSGSFVILSTTSYAMAILPHLLSGRKNVPQGPFWMGKAGFVVNTISVLLIIFTNVMFCFPYAMPVSVPVRNTGPYLAYKFPLRVSSAGHELQLSHTRRLCRPDGILVVDSREDAVSGAASPALDAAGHKIEVDI